MAVSLNGATDNFGPAIAYESVTVSTTVKTLTVDKYRWVGGAGELYEAREILITAEATNGLRYTLEGTDPVASTTGHLLAGGGSVVIKGYQNIAKLKMIREGASDAVIKVTYFG